MSHASKLLHHHPPPPASGGGPWAAVQGNAAGTSGSSLGVQYPSNATAGNLFVVCGFTRDGGGFTLTDDKSQTWTQQIYYNPSGLPTAVWTAPVSGSAVGSRPTVTLTNTGGQWVTLLVSEFSGVNTTSSPVSVYATRRVPFQGGDGATANVGPTATSGAHEPGLIYVQHEAGADLGNHTGWTEICHAVAASGAVIGGILCVKESDSAPYTGTVDEVPSSVGEWIGIAFCLKRA